MHPAFCRLAGAVYGQPYGDCRRYHPGYKTFQKPRVQRFKDEAFDPRKTGDDPIYAWLPGSDTYVQITEQVLADIHAGKFRY
ncbi:hypothetical protein [Pseudomonas brassicacearum]|uniref:Uncharacterized protein n=1 Tax=Pseudomonas brassicacearum TaxID=930166 RepID=A0A423H2D3_9PSED|nr:hypothetical protein [Pseudomonas brassicacearum]RON06387.1 hypothetical protein BK658_00980 [Pseudomonas brassicacearum]